MYLLSSTYLHSMYVELSKYIGRFLKTMTVSSCKLSQIKSCNSAGQAKFQATNFNPRVVIHKSQVANFRECLG